MKFDAPAQTNLFDDATIIGKSTPRIDGPRKTSGTVPYAAERHDVAANQAYGWIVGAGIAKGTIGSMDASAARKAPGVLAILTAPDTEPVGTSDWNAAPLFGGSDVTHYHQAVALVVAETFEQARAAAGMIRTVYKPADGVYDLERAKHEAEIGKGYDGKPSDNRIGDFDGAFAGAPVQIDARFHTANESHSMMEPFATIASWTGDNLTVWTSNQMIQWAKTALSQILDMDADNIRVDSPYIGGGFGAKLFVRADAVLAALGAKAVKRPVKIAMQRPLIPNNSPHRPATLQRVRLGARKDGNLVAVGHESWSGNVPGGDPENGVMQTRRLYAGPNRIATSYLTTLDLPEGNAMRAPGEAPGHMAIEVAMDELAEKLDMDPVELRIMNDTQVMPDEPSVKFSDRNLVRCLKEGADRFGWDKRGKPGTRREGAWLIGMGVAAGYRAAPTQKSAARVKLGRNGRIVVETDMTDIGTGSYTIIAQTAAETLGVPLDHVSVRLGDSDFPVSSGSGGQWGAASSTAGVYAACMALREKIAAKLGLDEATASFANGKVANGDRAFALTEAGALTAESGIEFGDFKNDYDVGSFAGHFCEVAVDAYTGEVRIRRMLAVCDAGRILNPLSARSQVIGGMTMAAGAALLEELAVDTRFGLFVNHDLAGYEVPVHADIPHQDVVFLDTLDPVIAPLKAKGVGELGICGVAPAVANAIYNATGIRTREYPITLDKYLGELPQIA
ncbi:MAG: aldehyde oxidoreductase molybdenum-binding subunit PaoC [Pontixanthobacter sp.]